MGILAHNAYEHLRERILSGDLAHDARLGEEELAEALGISRTPVREALRRLASEGLVELTANRGARVPRWDEDDVEDIFELRAALESHAARRAAGRIGAAQIAHLRALCAKMEQANAENRGVEGLPQLATINREWHTAVIEAAGSPRLSTLVSSLVHVPVVMQTFKNYTPEALDRSLRHHREVVEALAVGDGEWACSVMRAHVLAARHQVLASRPLRRDLPA